MAFPKTAVLVAVAALLVTGVPAAQTPQQPPAPVVTEGNFTIHNYTFRSGETMPEVRLHFRTRGTLQTDARGVATNAVLVMHGTGGTGAQFVTSSFSGELFGPGQPLDAAKYFIILPDGIGHGGSSKPSDGLRTKFPHYGYLDMVDLQHRLLVDGLGVNHARLVMGTSMGGMHTWLWGEQFPEFMDALMPLASVPGPISGRNRVWRRVLIDAIKNDPAWQGGNYTAEPPSLRTAAQMLWLISSNPVRRTREAPTLADADRVMEAYIANYVRTNDANDVIYWFEASRDYDPAPGLEKIVAPLLAVNSADDLVNPPEIGILEKEIGRVKHGRMVMIPLSDKTAGHGTHTLAAVWMDQLVQLLKDSAR